MIEKNASDVGSSRGEFSDAAADITLLEQARDAAKGAYVPYSEFPVGAAIRTTEGEDHHWVQHRKRQLWFNELRGTNSIVSHDCGKWRCSPYRHSCHCWSQSRTVLALWCVPAGFEGIRLFSCHCGEGIAPICITL